MKPKSSSLWDVPNAGAWLRRTLALLLAFLTLTVLINMLIDRYGVFGLSRSKALLALGDERVSKHLLAMRYVPENFKQILLGSSVSGNLQLGQGASEVYNFSINGANVVEIKALFDEYLAVRRPERVYLLVHPYFTADHRFATVTLGKHQWQSSLASLSLFEVYREDLAQGLGRRTAEVRPDGSYIFGDGTKPLNPELRQMFFDGADINVDPIAVKAFDETVKELNARQIQVVYLVLPMDERMLAVKRSAFERYVAARLVGKKPSDLVFDFTKEAAGEASPIKFMDGVHLTDSGAQALSQRIKSLLKEP
jgi:hypothetical protein